MLHHIITTNSSPENEMGEPIDYTVDPSHLPKVGKGNNETDFTDPPMSSHCSEIDVPLSVINYNHHTTIFYGIYNENTCNVSATLVHFYVIGRDYHPFKSIMFALLFIKLHSLRPKVINILYGV